MPSYNFTVFNDYGRHDYVGTDMSVEQGLLTIADDGVSVVHFAPGTWRHVERSFEHEDDAEISRRIIHGYEEARSAEHPAVSPAEDSP